MKENVLAFLSGLRKGFGGAGSLWLWSVLIVIAFAISPVAAFFLLLYRLFPRGRR